MRTIRTMMIVGKGLELADQKNDNCSPTAGLTSIISYPPQCRVVAVDLAQHELRALTASTRFLEDTTRKVYEPLLAYERIFIVTS